MFELCLQKTFRASHALVGGNWGPENAPHFHDYKLEWLIEGPDLDRHNYLADLVELEALLGALVSKYSERHLNDMSEFVGQNPSLEFFARILWDELFLPLQGRGISGKVILWENEQAWASYRGKL